MCEIQNMREYLPTLIHALGWTYAELGEKLGISRQQIYAWIQGDSRFKKMHYLAISKLVLDEIEECGTEAMIARFLFDFYIDNGDIFMFDSKEQHDEILSMIRSLCAIRLIPGDNRKAVNHAFINWMQLKGYTYFYDEL